LTVYVTYKTIKPLTLWLLYQNCLINLLLSTFLNFIYVDINIIRVF